MERADSDPRNFKNSGDLADSFSLPDKLAVPHARKLLLFSVGILCVLSSSVFAQETKTQKKPKIDFSKPLYSISKETTFVLGPLTKDGHIDFVGAINNRYSKGVTPQNNGAVLYLKAMGPISDGKVLPKELFDKLGIEVLPLRDEYFLGLFTFIEKEFGLKGNVPDSEKLSANFGKAMEKPWRVSELPHIAAWLKVNQKALSLIIEGSKRDRYYLPVVRLPDTEFGPGTILDSSMRMNQNSRDFARVMSCSAMLKIAEGNRQQAWETILAIHRLSRHVSNGPSIIDHLIGLSVGEIASENALIFLHHTKPDSVAVKKYLNDLAKLPRRTRMIDLVNFGERIQFLDTFLQMMIFGSKHSSPKEQKEMAKQFDLDTLFRSGMRGYDRAVKIMRIPDYRKRNTAFEKLEKEAKAIPNIAVMDQKIKNGKVTKKEFSEYMGKMMVALAIPAFAQVQQTEMREQQRHHNLLLAFALAAYRSDQGKYPAKLADLLPKYFDKIPSDLYTGKPLKYKTTKDGYLLYSLGANGKDDQGNSTYSGDKTGDDITIKMPLH